MKISWIAVTISMLFSALSWYVIAPLLARDPTTAEIAQVFLASRVQACRPESLEDIRYLLLMVTAPLSFGVSLFALRSWFRRCPDALRSPVFEWNRWVALEALVLLGIYHWESQEHRYYSDQISLVISAVILAAGLLIFKPAQRRLNGLSWAAYGIGMLIAAIYLMTILVTPNTIGLAHEGFIGHLQTTSAEFAAVLNGRRLFFDFFPQYQNLTPYLFLPYFKALGFSGTTFCALMLILNALGILCIYRSLRLYTGSPWSGLFLFLPWIAACFHPMDIKAGGLHFHVLNYYAIGPLRYFGPWLLTFLLTRYLFNPRPGRCVALSAVGAWVAINNLDFGLPAYGGMVLAILTVESKGARDWAGLKMSFSRCVMGLVIGVSTSALLIGLMAGAVPNFLPILEFQNLFFRNGFFSLPAPTFGLHWIIFATHMTALFLGLSRLFLADAADLQTRVRSGLLIFSGVFGAGTLTYYIGRSHPHVLTATFPAWTFSLMLLLWPMLEKIPFLSFKKRKWEFVTVACSVFFYSTVVQSLRFLPSPSGQVNRLRQSDQGAADAERDKCVQMIRRYTHPGEKVGIAYSNPHLLALESGTENVFPFAHIGSVIGQGQLKLATDAFTRHSVRTIFGSTSVITEFNEWLKLNGYVEKESIPIARGEADFKVYSLETHIQNRRDGE